ncbi:MAG: lipid-A-disaccharide synthase, partial [Moraxellaceae bacterium]|nr:lipid-A-disaccharide synthase [Moraxellaceae bacterium]
MAAKQGPVFGIVAGEVSGDTLGAGLIRALKQHYPNAEFIGIAGPQMIAEGAKTLVPMDRLSVMGLVEVLGRLKELFRVRDELINTFAERKIDAFIGIDAPDFNLRVAAQLKQRGITTIHYVSPSVWAWRQGRVHGIRASIDLMLCLLPFEKAFYDKHQVPAVFVGHPLADSLPMHNDASAARTALGLEQQGHIVG